MPKPATTGKLMTRIEDMKIGDYISCRYQASNGQVGTFSDLGTAEGEEIPVEGASSPNGIFYFIKTDRGLLIADRVIQHSISWNALNTGKVIQSKVISGWDSNNTQGIIITDNNLTISREGSGWSSSSVGIGKSTGKWYWEIELVDFVGGTSSNAKKNISGVVNTDGIKSNYPGINANGLGFHTSINRIYTEGKYYEYGNNIAKKGDVVGIALDIDEGKIEFFINGESQGLITDGIRQLGVPLYACEGLNASGATITANFGLKPFRYNPPEGYSPYFEQEFQIRSLSGGVAYADEHGNISLTDKGYGGWPVNNEWDKYIVNFSRELIQEGKTLDDVFHWSECLTWCQDTPVNGLINHNGTIQAVNTHRIWRGSIGGLSGNPRIEVSYINFSSSSHIFDRLGFRPVFEYKEV